MFLNRPCPLVRLAGKILTLQLPASVVLTALALVGLGYSVVAVMDGLPVGHGGGEPSEYEMLKPAFSTWRIRWLRPFIGFL